MSVHDMSKMASAKKLAGELGIGAAHLQAGSAEANTAGPRLEPDDGAILAQDYGMSYAPAVQERELAPHLQAGFAEAITAGTRLQVIEGEILFYKRQAGRSIIEIGRRLNEAKTQLSHGEWLPWLREKVDISERSAQDFMRLAREYSESAEIADLGAAKALALLGLPVSERSDFVAEKHLVDGVEKSVSDMTAKELKQAIRERDEARAAAEAAQADARHAEESRAKMEAEQAALKGLLEDARANEERAEQAMQTVREELEELKRRPVEVAVEVRDAAPEQLEKAKAAGRAEAEKKKATEMAAKEEQLKKAKEELKKAKAEADAARLNLKTAEKEAAAAREEANRAARMAKVGENQNFVKFGVLFQQAQDTVNKMAELRGAESEENRGKMRNALVALADAIRRAADA